MCSLCRDRNSCEDETCNSRSVPVNIRFKYRIWKPSLRRQKSNKFNNNFAQASRFFVHFFAVTARLRHESALLWRAKTQYSDFLFLFLNIDTVLRRTEGEEIIANTLFKWRFCSCPRHCCWSFLPRAWSKISSRRLRNLIGQLSFLLVPNMALAKINIHEYRTKQTCESYTFQPFMSYASQTLWALAQFSTHCACCFNTFSHLLYCVFCPCNSSFCF